MLQAGSNRSAAEDVIEATEIPAEWLRKLAEKHLTEEEKAEIEALGGFDKLMETLRKRLEEQKGRHQGGSKWIGTAGTSPFGAYGYNPEGVRIGQNESRHRRAVKVWDKREFRNLDDSVETRHPQHQGRAEALRQWARDGAAEELDLDGTIRATAEHGYLDVQTRPERRNAVKVILFLDVGGSMDDHVKVVEELFSAARAEFKHLEYYYFHNCLYEGVWRDNRRRWTERQIPTHEVMNTYGSDYKCIFVGDASMSPYEIAFPAAPTSTGTRRRGRSGWNARGRNGRTTCGSTRCRKYWDYTQSIGMIRQIFEDRMVPMTLEGIERVLGR
jgi:uncharacterized protein with von Willebrand factor type A (vWA) domain